MNSVCLIGNLTRDVNLKNTRTGSIMCDFGLAVNDRRKGENGELIDNPLFIDVKAFNKTAELVSQYCSKGKKVAIHGKLEFSTWVGDKDGQKHSRICLVADRVDFLSAPDGGDPTAKPQAEKPATSSFDEDIPF